MTITLATLHTATAQEVFDQVARHLLTQGKRSVNDLGWCAYRSPDGLKCAAGALMSDAEYDSDWDCELGINWYSLSTNYLGHDKHRELISDLQTVHDSHHPKLWRQWLQAAADRHLVSAHVLDEFPS